MIHNIHCLDNRFSNSMFIHDVIFFSIGQKACSLVYSCPRIQSSTVTVYIVFFWGGWQSEKTAWTHKTQQRSHYINGSDMKRSNMFVWLKVLYELCIVYSDIYLYIQYIQYTHIYIYMMYQFRHL